MRLGLKAKKLYQTYVKDSQLISLELLNHFVSSSTILEHRIMSEQNFRWLCQCYPEQFLRSGIWILCYEFSMHSDFRSSITVSKVAAQMFLCVNGPPALVRVLRKWLMRHRSTLNNQSPKLKPQKITDLAFPQKLFCQSDSCVNFCIFIVLSQENIQ